MRDIERDIAETPAVVVRMLEANAGALVKARAILQRANLVRVLAIGSSRHAGGYAAACIESLAGRAAAVAEAPGAGVPHPRWRSDDVALVISQSGATPALLAAVDHATNAGVIVVAIVNEPDSPLAARSDVVLACGAGPERVVAATKSVVAQMVLGRAAAGNLDGRAAAGLSEALAAAVALDVGDTVGRPRPEAVVAGGFAGGWLADEVALKFAEVGGWTVASESLVEYLHGPVAAGARILALVDGNDPNASLLPHGRAVRVGVDTGADVVAPTTRDPSLDVPVRLVVAQRLVVGWAEAVGENPDGARGLAKITATR